jgi:hypothetical protein
MWGKHRLSARKEGFYQSTSNVAMAVVGPGTIDTVSIKVRMTKDTIELFSVPVPARQLEFSFQDSAEVRVLDNPLEDNLRNYVAWGRL